jgi:epoxyqueuosine reductase
MRGVWSRAGQPAGGSGVARTMNRAGIEERLKAAALDAGFERAGIARLRPSDHGAYYRAWLAAGRHGEMGYLARPDAVAKRLDPAAAWPELRSALVVLLRYHSHDEGAEPAADPSRGIIARYARGRDYHKVVKKKLLRLLDWLEAETARELPAARAYVDTGPVLERELARRAGLGWFGRNTMLIHPRGGSYVFIGALLLELELEADAAFEADRCGTCTACVDACPTGALLGRDADGAPVMDATRCISYLTIENRGAIPEELRPAIGNRVFGCDICQEVCPFPRKFSRPTSEPAFASRGPGEPPFGVERLPSDGWHPGTRSPSLVVLMSMDESGWEAFSRGSPVRRAGRAGFLRNVAVSLGNWASPKAVPVLTAALSDPEPLVRGHAAWALGEISSPASLAALDAARASERDISVLEELDAALARRPSKVK